MKRLIDILASCTGLLLLSPFFFLVALAIWLEDRGSPFYRAPRMARGGGRFRMLKFRSMIVGADRAGVCSTSATDRRITRVGRFVRATKLDEFTQLWNVLCSDMSLVGPRPQVEKDAVLYTPEERRMLTVRPGITDLASIVFADEGEILRGSSDPDLLYNQIIRPWKSRLALLSIDHSTTALDLRIIGLTALSFLSRRRALSAVGALLEGWRADPLLIRMSARQEPLRPAPPPGAPAVVSTPRAGAPSSTVAAPAAAVPAGPGRRS